MDLTKLTFSYMISEDVNQYNFSESNLNKLWFIHKTEYYAVQSKNGVELHALIGNDL